MQGHEAWNWGSSNLVMQRCLGLLAFSEVMRDEGPTDGRVEGWRDCGLWSSHGLSYETGHTWCYYWPWSFHILNQLCCSVAQSCPTLWPHDGSTPGFPVLYHLLELVHTHVTELVMPSNHLVLCHPLLLLPSIVPSIRVFSNKSALQIRWPKYRSFSFSFSISPSKEHPDWSPLGLTGLISSQSKGLSRVFSNTTVQKHQFFGVQLSLWSNSHIHTWLLEKL